MTINELAKKELRISRWESRGEVLTRAELEEELEYPNVDYIDLVR